MFSIQANEGRRRLVIKITVAQKEVLREDVNKEDGLDRTHSG